MYTEPEPLEQGHSRGRQVAKALGVKTYFIIGSLDTVGEQRSLFSFKMHVQVRKREMFPKLPYKQKLLCSL